MNFPFCIFEDTGLYYTDKMHMGNQRHQEI